jgi:hypothetical protein
MEEVASALLAELEAVPPPDEDKEEDVPGSVLADVLLVCPFCNDPSEVVARGQIMFAKCLARRAWPAAGHRSSSTRRGLRR